MSAQEGVQNGGSKFLIDESGVTEIQKHEDDITRITGEAKDWVIKDERDEVYAVELLGEIKKHQKNAKKDHDDLIKPLNEHKKKLMDYYHKVIDPLSRAESLLKQRMGEYHAEEERKRKELQAKKDAEYNKQMEEHRKKALESSDENVTAVAPPVPVIIEEKPKQVKTAGVTVSMVDTLLNDNIRILDIMKVPRELCTPDLKLIRKRIESGIREIPGVRWEIVKRPKVRV